MKQIPEPWRLFFSAIDNILDEETRLEILGGFVFTVLYNLPQTTADI